MDDTDDTLLDRLETALSELKGTPPDRKRFANADKDVLRVLVDTAERAVRAQAQVWALVEATADPEPSLVRWPARLFHDLSATGEEAERTDAQLRDCAAKVAQDRAERQRQALGTVSELVEERQARLEEQVQQAEAEILAGPPPHPKLGFILP
jgi:ABC-type transporter Mla subunit MlaD